MAGVWYRAGTIAVTSGSKKVTGTGTSWANAQNGIAKGTALVLASGASVDVYEVDRVESNTVLYLVDNYRAASGTGKQYAIDTTRTDSIPEFARRLAATLSYHQANLDVLQQLYTSTAASITFTAPDGTEITAIPWKNLEQQAGRSLEDMGAGTAARMDAVGAVLLNNSGAIIERGSNTDGDYLKMADGTLYCFGVIDIDLSQPMTQFSKAFPHQFSTYPTVLLGASAYTISSPTHKALSDVRANIPTNTLLRIQTGNEVSGSSLSFQYFAKGVWFQ